MRQIESMEFSLQVGAEPTKLFLVWHRDSPGERKRVLDLFELEHEGEDFIVVVHDFFGKNSRERGQVWHFVVQQEGFPASVLLRGLQQFDIQSTDELLLVELSITRSYRRVKIGSHRMLVDVRRTFGQLVGEQIDQVLHEIPLSHQKVLANVRAVPLKLVLREENVQKLLIGLLVRRLNPLLQLVDV